VARTPDLARGPTIFSPLKRVVLQRLHHLEKELIGVAPQRRMTDRQGVVVDVVAQHVRLGHDDKTILLDQYTGTIDRDAMQFDVIAAGRIADVIDDAQDTAGF
jgi:hypothetical protein